MCDIAAGRDGHLFKLNLAFQKFGDVYADGEENDGKNVTNKVPSAPAQSFQ